MGKATGISNWLRENNSNFRDKETLVQGCMKATGKSRDSIMDAYRRLYSKNKIRPHNGAKLGLTESELRAKHDNMYKIREGVKQLQEGIYLTDQQMREFCKINTTQWRGYSENAEFDDYKIRVNSNTIYWGVPDCVERLRSDLNLV